MIERTVIERTVIKRTVIKRTVIKRTVAVDQGRVHLRTVQAGSGSRGGGNALQRQGVVHRGQGARA